MSAPPFENKKTCNKCGTTFGLVNRQHHCRNCGRSFCNGCSKANIPLPHYKLTEPQRVCDECLVHVQQHYKQKAAQAAQQQGSSPISATPPAAGTLPPAAAASVSPSGASAAYAASASTSSRPAFGAGPTPTSNFFSPSSSSSSAAAAAAAAAAASSNGTRAKNCKCNSPLCVCPPDDDSKTGSVAPLAAAPAAAPAAAAASAPAAAATSQFARSQFNASVAAQPAAAAVPKRTGGATTSFQSLGGGGFSGFGRQSAVVYDLNGDLDAQCRDAIKNNDSAGVAKLLAAGANARFVDHTGNSLLHLAAMFDRYDIARQLIAKGASLTEKNSTGETPLDLAPPAMQHKLTAQQAGA